MKTIKRFAAIALLLCSVVAVNAQNKVLTQASRYADAFGLDKNQMEKIEKIYAETDADMKALGERMVAHRLKLQTISNIPEENAKWKADQKTLSDEHRAIQDIRDAEMLNVFNKKQKAAWKKWKAGELSWSEIPASLEE